MKIKIGVMGSAQGPSIERAKNNLLATEVGKWIAKTGCILVNGACPGLPNEAAIGAKENGGFVLGVSPAFSKAEHTERYRSPEMAYDLILYTGMGLMERDILNIRSSDGVIIIGGGIGTLNEFTVALDEGKVVGVLTGSDGISDHIPEIVKMCNREDDLKNVIFDADPRKLVERMVLAINENGTAEFEDERVTGKR